LVGWLVGWLVLIFHCVFLMSKMRQIIKNKSKGPSELQETKGKGFFRLAAAPASGSKYQKQRAAKTKAMLVIK
jgi:hypothetical protein